jgi:heptosyltransferase III
MTSSDPAGPLRRRVCLIHAGAIGDFILALRVAGSVRAAHPEAEIEVLGHRSIASLAVGRGGVDRVRSLEALPLHTMFADAAAAAAACRDYFARFDLILNMYGSPEAPFTRALRGISDAEVVTIETAPGRAGSHITDGWTDALRAAGIPPVDTPPALTFTDEERGRGRRCLQNVAGGADHPIVLVHPGSGGRAKCWPIGDFIRLVDRLRQLDVRPVLMLGPVEREHPGMHPVDRLAAAAPVFVEPDLSLAAAAIAGAEVYVGNDAGMTHLAAAVGTPVVAIFGPTDPAVWRPLGERVRVLCGSPPGTFNGVTVDLVTEAVRSALGGSAG